MFIIFDLDDTLIDTTGVTTPFLLEKALVEMQKKGFPINNLLEEKQILVDLDKTSLSARHTLEKYLDAKKALPIFLPIGLSVLYKEFPDNCPVVLRKNASQVVYNLKKDHNLALVTAGIYERQILKLKKAGIDRGDFCKIIVTDTKDKEKAYKEILQEFSLLPREVVVCADRIDTDLVPAKKLGMTTVHMCYGRGCYQKQGSESVDFTIQELDELEKIIVKLMEIV